MGLDFEMTIHDHYFEVLDVIEKVFQYIFEGLATTCGARSASCSHTWLAQNVELLEKAQSNCSRCSLLYRNAFMLTL